MQGGNYHCWFSSVLKIRGKNMLYFFLLFVFPFVLFPYCFHFTWATLFLKAVFNLAFIGTLEEWALTKCLEKCEKVNPLSTGKKSKQKILISLQLFLLSKTLGERPSLIHPSQPMWGKEYMWHKSQLPFPLRL